MGLVVGRVAAVTDPGRRRRHNEDSYVCAPPLFAIADGMGGAQAGELASRLAKTAIEESAGEAVDEDGVVDAIQSANTRVFERALQDPSAAGMGTTATVALVDEQEALLRLGHVGDSRAYRYRGGELEQLTVDHSLVGELIRAGRLTEDEAAVHPHRSVITRALGTEPDVDVDMTSTDLAQGDILLLCSDGLSAMVRDADIARVLEAQALDPQRAAEALVGAANAAGAIDNVTVVLVELVEGEPGERRAVSPVPEDEIPDPSELEQTEEDVARHGPGKGSRWLALLLVLGLIAATAFVLWWSFLA